MNATEQKILADIKKAYLGGSAAVQAEVNKLLIGEKPLLQRNVYWAMLACGVVGIALGHFI